MQEGAKKTILRVEFWHVALLLSLLMAFRGTQLINARALLIGGVFMGVNFFLLSFGIAWVLTPLAGRGRIKAGVSLLSLKIIVFLGLLTTVFFRFELDPISFALGFSTLIVALLIEAFRRHAWFGT